MTDVLFGEVWVVSGQSNAAFTLGMQASGDGELAANATAEIAGSARFADSIRLFNTGIVKADTPQVHCTTAHGTIAARSQHRSSNTIRCFPNSLPFTG
jgi:hypothetical protein